MGSLITNEDSSKSSSTSSINRERSIKIPSFPVELPSKGVFYKDNLSAVQIRPFSVKQIKQLLGAVRTKNASEKEQIIAETVAESIENFDVYDLTYNDFEYVLYWLRINSYKKSPMVVNWSYQLDEVTKKCTTNITESELRYIECDPVKRPLNKDFKFTTVRDKIELAKLEDEAEIYIASYASVLSSRDENDKIVTLAQKVDKLGKYPADVIIDIKEHLNRFAHGVEEYVTVRDIEVENSEEFKIKLELQISDFFP